MPFSIERRGDKWIVRNEETGDVKGTHDSEEKAKSQLRLLNAIKHGFTPKK